MTDETHDSALSADEAAQAHDPNVGAGTPDTAPWEEPAVSWFRRQPLVAALLISNGPLIAGAASSVATGQPWWVSLLLSTGVLAVNGLVGAARRAVTPVSRPRDNHGNTLTP